MAFGEVCHECLKGIWWGRGIALSEVLSDATAPPYTLKAFMTYLSESHCLETLQFGRSGYNVRRQKELIKHAQVSACRGVGRNIRFTRLPYTLKAFMTYLSESHCLETLQFTLAAKEYCETYNMP
jgi:hypothetical protein